MNAILQPLDAALHLDFASTYHIGSGRGGGLIHRAIKRDGQSRPYVPASALKGALRISAERVIALLSRENTELGQRRRGAERVSKPCRAPHAEEMCQSHSPCIVCRVFGNVFTGNRMLVDDAQAVTDDALTTHLHTFHRLEAEATSADGMLPRPYADAEMLTRVQMDRRRRAAKSRALFTSEYARPAHQFAGRLFGRIPLTVIDDAVPPLELVLIAASVHFTEQIGAEASIGRGRCRLSFDGEKLTAGGRDYAISHLIDHLDYLVFDTE